MSDRDLSLRWLSFCQRENCLLTEPVNEAALRFVEREVAAERERCAKVIAEEVAKMKATRDRVDNWPHGKYARVTAAVENFGHILVAAIRPPCSSEGRGNAERLSGCECHNCQGEGRKGGAA